jgi:hypothetical protein
MNQHPAEVNAFMRECNVGARKSLRPRQIAEYEDKYGERKIIWLTRGGLRVKRNSSTLILELNPVVGKILSENLKKRRLQLGLTLKEAALRCGIVAGDPKSRMWEIENNLAKQGIRFGTLYALALGFETEVSKLLPTVNQVLRASNISRTEQTILKISGEVK